MSYWDASALAKLYLHEPDSMQFRGFAAAADRIVTASLSRHELRTVFRRRESEGALPAGETAILHDELTAHIASAAITIQPETGDVEREFGIVLETCFSQPLSVFLRTNDALHLASARAAGETHFVTADQRQRATALLLGFTVQP